MKKKLLRIIAALVVFVIAFAGLSACGKNNDPEKPTTAPIETTAPVETREEPTTEAPTQKPTELETTTEPDYGVVEDGEYTSKEEVALYIHLYGHLPSNYITKSEAEDLGWKNGKSTVAKAAPGKSIGGDKFGNREGLLPKADGRQYYECDIDYVKGNRNAKRIIYSNDGLVYYTEDHYESFELLYGEE